jgi:hypothetical protein
LFPKKVIFLLNCEKTLLCKFNLIFTVLKGQVCAQMRKLFNLLMLYGALIFLWEKSKRKKITLSKFLPSFPQISYFPRKLPSGIIFLHKHKKLQNSKKNLNFVSFPSCIWFNSFTLIEILHFKVKLFYAKWYVILKQKKKISILISKNTFKINFCT